MSEKCSHKNLYVNVYSSPVHSCHNLGTIWASQVALVVKNPPANLGDIKDRGHKRSLGCVRKFPWRRAWQPTLILAWRISWTEKPARVWSIWSERVRHNLNDLTCTGTIRMCPLDSLFSQGNTLHQLKVKKKKGETSDICNYLDDSQTIYFGQEIHIKITYRMILYM